MKTTENLDWAIGLAVFFVILLISLVRSHSKAFSLKIFLMVADLCGIVYFLAGEFWALGAVFFGLIFSFITIHPEKK